VTVCGLCEMQIEGEVPLTVRLFGLCTYHLGRPDVHGMPEEKLISLPLGGISIGLSETSTYSGSYGCLECCAREVDTLRRRRVSQPRRCGIAGSDSVLTGRMARATSCNTGTYCLWGPVACSFLNRSTDGPHHRCSCPVTSCTIHLFGSPCDDCTHIWANPTMGTPAVGNSWSFDDML
jgi:hypothetical protein